MDRETLLRLEDISYLAGSIDDAVCVAIREYHSKIFEGPEGEAYRTSIEEAIDALREKISELVATMSMRSTPSRPPEVELPSNLEIVAPEEPKDLDEIIEDIAVVEYDDSLMGEVEEYAEDRNTKTDDEKKTS